MGHPCDSTGTVNLPFAPHGRSRARGRNHDWPSRRNPVARGPTSTAGPRPRPRGKSVYDSMKPWKEGQFGAFQNMTCVVRGPRMRE